MTGEGLAMGEIVNLNRVRKARAKTEAKSLAATNRVAHGRTAGERKAAEAERMRLERLLDGAKKDD